MSSLVTPQDYASYVDGMPRQDGVRAFLDARGIRLPAEGTPDSPPTRSRSGASATGRNCWWRSSPGRRRERGPTPHA